MTFISRPHCGRTCEHQVFMFMVAIRLNRFREKIKLYRFAISTDVNFYCFGAFSEQKISMTRIDSSNRSTFQKQVCHIIVYLRNRQNLIVCYRVYMFLAYLFRWYKSRCQMAGERGKELVHKLLRSSLVDRSVNRLRSATKFALLMHFNRPRELSDDNYWKID